jgi:pyruvate/2-oxoglutarate dehydrogenase complex dihydrolipoamide dehydrogenase (E3) component
MPTEPSLIVVGGGPAGTTAALQGAELGGQVTLLEAGGLGGSTLNRGPAPVRTLARAARLMRDWSSWEAFGLHGAAPAPDLVSVVANSQRVARYAQEKKDLSGHVRRHGIDLREDLGPVHFVDAHTLAADDGRTWSASRIILAVGGHAAHLPIPGAELGLTYEDIPSLVELPRHAVVVGGADTGCQIASILADLGVTVAVFEAGDRLLPSADSTVSFELRRAYEVQGIEVHTETLVEALRKEEAGIRICCRKGESAEDTLADTVFFAVGWPANVDQLALAQAGVLADRRTIPVDVFLRTNVDHIFAVGDVNGRSMLVQTARLEGRIAAHNAVLGPSRQATYDVVPSGSFTDPEYGRVGLTEAEAAQEHDVVTGIARYDDLLRPVADGRPEGFCKLIADRSSHMILGAHVLGEYSAETVQTVAACMVGGMTVERVAELQLAFPTFTEGVSMAAQMICRTLDVGRFPRVWSYLGSEDDD